MQAKLRVTLHPFDTLAVTFAGGCAYFRGMRGECDDVRVVVNAAGVPAWELMLDGQWVPVVPAEILYALKPEPALASPPSHQPDPSSESEPSSPSAS